MTLHDDGAHKEAKKKRKVVPISERRRVGDCEPGDVVEFPDGRRAVVTSWLNGGPFGRWLSSEGVEGEFMPISAELECRRLSGYR